MIPGCAAVIKENADGFFNAAFARKEYMEGYVAEEEARKMLAASPAVRAEFEARLQYPAFAKSAEARLDFFYQRQPARDERFNLVPVLRVAASPLDIRANHCTVFGDAKRP